MIFISCTCKADDAVGTFVPLPVESEMCRKVQRGFAPFDKQSACFFGSILCNPQLCTPAATAP